MMTLLAATLLFAVAISQIIWGLFLALCAVALVGAIWWVFRFLVKTWELPSIVQKIGDTVFVLAALGLVILIVLSMANPDAIRW